VLEVIEDWEERLIRERWWQDNVGDYCLNDENRWNTRLLC
jgi:hypothetical protein